MVQELPRGRVDDADMTRDMRAQVHQGLFFQESEDYPLNLHSFSSPSPGTDIVSSVGDWHVVLACRDFLKAERMAKRFGLQEDQYTILHLDLSSLESVRQFVDNLRCGLQFNIPLAALNVHCAAHLHAYTTPVLAPQ